MVVVVGCGDVEDVGGMVIVSELSWDEGEVCSL